MRLFLLPSQSRGLVFGTLIAAVATLFIAPVVDVFAEQPLEPHSEAEKTLHSDEATTQLLTLLNTFSGFSAQFKQELKGRDGEVLQQLSGTLLVDKPNRFRWQSLEPFPQEVVCNGTKIWIYDQDLDQVTVKKFDSESASSPAMIFSGDTAAIRSLYQINYDTNTKGKTQTFKLIPRQKSGLFESLTLTFIAGTANMMIMSDSLGQTTTIIFERFSPNPSIAKNAFHFQAPEGVDVLYDE